MFKEFGVFVGEELFDDVFVEEGFGVRRGF